MLIYEAILGASAAGMHTFDFLRGTEKYKYRFGACDALDLTLEIPRGLTGYALGARRQTRALVYPQRRA